MDNDEELMTLLIIHYSFLMRKPAVGNSSGD